MADIITYASTGTTYNNGAATIRSTNIGVSQSTSVNVSNDNIVSYSGILDDRLEALSSCCAAGSGAVTSIVAGTGITISSATGDVTINAISGSGTDWTEATQLQVDLQTSGHFAMTPAKFRFRREVTGSFTGPDVTGGTRGAYALDLQTIRSTIQVASGDYSTAIGAYNKVGIYPNSIAAGSNNTLIGQNSSAFGSYNTQKTGGSANIIGSMVGYYNVASGSMNIAYGIENSALGAGSCMAMGIQNYAYPQFATAVGLWNSVDLDTRTGGGGYSSSFGAYNNTYGTYCSALGAYNTVDAMNNGRASAVGAYNEARGEKSSAFGYANDATGVASSAFGRLNYAFGDRSSAFGSSCGVVVSGYNSSAFGYYARANANRSAVFGYGVKTAVAQTVEIGYWTAAATRNGAVRLHKNGQAAFTSVDSGVAPTDGGATHGGEAETTLPRSMYSIRHSGLAFFLDYNNSGTIRTLSLGTAS